VYTGSSPSHEYISRAVEYAGSNMRGLVKPTVSSVYLGPAKYIREFSIEPNIYYAACQRSSPEQEYIAGMLNYEYIQPRVYLIMTIPSYNCI
jgi:hypothetical protein